MDTEWTQEKGKQVKSNTDKEREIGMTGFEPATPSSQAKCATKLRYIPI